MTYYVSEDQMAVIGLIRERIEYMFELEKEHGGFTSYHGGKMAAYRSIIDYLDLFDVLEDEE